MNLQTVHSTMIKRAQLYIPQDKPVDDGPFIWYNDFGKTLRPEDFAKQFVSHLNGLKRYKESLEAPREIFKVRGSYEPGRSGGAFKPDTKLDRNAADANAYNYNNAERRAAEAKEIGEKIKNQMKWLKNLKLKKVTP